jgi:uncharacterized membrane protein YphA (DoxX/SURF4 family)
MKSRQLLASLALAFAAAGLTAETVAAHEKWFVDANPYPVNWWTTLDFPSNVGVLGAVLLALLVGWVANRRAGRDYIPGPERLGAPPDARASFYGLVPLILGIHVGITLIVFGIRGQLFSPNNVLAPPWVYWLGLAEIGIGLCLVYGIMARLAGLLLALLWLIGIGVRGPELMLENLYYLGFAAFFALTGRGPFAADRLLFPALEPSPRLSLLAMPSLRIATGLALVVVAFTEKLANPALGLRFIAEYPLNFSSSAGLSVSDEVFVVGAGATELFIGLCVVFGYFPRLIIIATWFFINLTLTIFNWLELLGHLPLYGVMAVFLIWSPKGDNPQLWLRGVLGREQAAGQVSPALAPGRGEPARAFAPLGPERPGRRAIV